MGEERGDMERVPVIIYITKAEADEFIKEDFWIYSSMPREVLYRFIQYLHGLGYELTEESIRNSINMIPGELALTKEEFDSYPSIDISQQLNGDYGAN
jgi:hypothetical protein